MWSLKLLFRLNTDCLNFFKPMYLRHYCKRYLLYRYGKTEAVLRLLLRLFWKFEKNLITFRYLRAFFNKTIFRMLWHSLLKMASMHLRSGLKKALFSQWLVFIHVIHYWLTNILRAQFLRFQHPILLRSNFLLSFGGLRGL